MKSPTSQSSSSNSKPSLFMETTGVSPSWKAIILFIALFSVVISCRAISHATTDQKIYIVYMGDRPKGDFSATVQHMSMLQATLGSKRARESWRYSYTRSFSGFVAKLTEEESKQIASLEGVVSVFPSTKKQLHTTRSWDFMGFPADSQRSNTESDVIVGMLDTGIWPESQSFSDKGYGSPPSRWKGSCQSSSNFTCNNKIVGAKYYHSEGKISEPDFPSPRDSEGHGTHTASTAAGGLVSGANLYDLAAGTARGGVPSARLAVYKICWSDGCSDADILAAFDDAIADGVDIISLSVGGFLPSDYFVDSIAIGAFHAMKNGILTSNSAGNEGPYPESITNFSPWSLSVAASTIDRKFLSEVQLGNDKSYEGVAINTFTLKEKDYPLVYAGDVPNTAGGYDSSTSRYCNIPDSLDPNLVKGTIVLCDEISYADAVITANGTGAIMNGDYFRDVAFVFPLPASYLSSAEGSEVYGYINTTSKPTATILKSTEANETLAPFVASFSSRGPNPITRNIIKPDLTAPGVDILAAWSEATSLTGYPDDTRIVPYNIISGTSMSCPHASGAAAYVKSFNPTWSPAAIKSALMTTAAIMSRDTNTDGEFAYGSGHINPVKAKSPGLVYDLGEADYVALLCGQGYSSKNLRLITGDSSTCTAANNGSVFDFNYPSFSVSGASGTSVSAVYHRTVTNVGSPSSTYNAVVASAAGVTIDVQPSTLTFTSVGETQSFVVTVTATVTDVTLSSSLVWDDGTYQVRSPVVVYAA